MRCALSQGIDKIEVPDKRNGWTPLRWAVEFGRSEAVPLLLEAGADMHAKGVKDRKTPLLAAATQGDTDTLEMMFERGASVYAEDLYRALPLQANMEDGSNEVVGFLLHRGGADVEEQQGDKGYTPLHVAAGHGNVDFMRLFLECGAKIDVQDERWQRPFAYCSIA